MRLFLKMGVPPFHMWIVSLIQRIRKLRAAFIITAHKFLPLWVLTGVLPLEQASSCGGGILLLGTALIALFRGVLLVMLASSMVHAG
jgi:NADH:ubiquinone oxidoreductase subunit 2 (subunit N)